MASAMSARTARSASPAQRSRASLRSGCKSAAALWSMDLPAEEAHRGTVEPSGPADEVADAARGEQRAPRLRAPHAKILRVGDDPPGAQRRGTPRVGGQTHRGGAADG